MRFSLLWLPLFFLGCGDKDSADDTALAADPGTSSACTGEILGDNTACVDYDGTASSLVDGVAYNGAGSAAGLLIAGFANAEGMSLNIMWSSSSAAGEYDCSGETYVTVGADGESWGAGTGYDYYGAWCTFTLDTVGSAVGDVVEGRFDGGFYETSTTDIVPIAGSFKTSVMW